ncbi:hypothetical protein [Adonisia turfae]|uniref:hypothetical protein n=1 Tax=Adonisia turfae TaxID=2950184 RepID=UPI0013D0565C|nr:hypothetical protein [Adonisia turfae]
MRKEVIDRLKSLGDTWFPLARGTVREGSSILAPLVGTPPPAAPPLLKGRSVAAGGEAEGVQAPKPSPYNKIPNQPTLLHYRNLGILAFLLILQGFFPTAALASARIVSIQRGTVQVQRRGSSGYVQGRVGTQLNPGDALIIPNRKTRVRVQCPSGARRRATAGRRSGMRVICPDLARSTDPRNDNDLLQLLAGQFPYKPQVLDTVPGFYWPGLVGVDEYQVQLLQQEYVQPESEDAFTFAPPELVETVVWESTVLGNNLVYDGPEFEPGERYRFQVMAGTELHYSVAFQALAVEKQEEVSVATASLTDGDVLLMAYVHLEQGLFWEVIATLRPVVEAGGASAEMHRLLAESYLRVGLPGLAETHYGAAVALADESGGVRTRAEGWVGLAKVAAMQQDEALVRQRLVAAQVLYRALEMDEGWLETIEVWLAGLDGG